MGTGYHNVDVVMMRRALALARRGEGWVEPDPMVGCVIVRDRRVIGEGFHRRFGGPHAEIEALKACGNRAGGATIYISLEPCCHHGKTPPCTDALIAARPARVVFPLLDPNPLVSGKGLRQLRRAGIEVDNGVLAEKAADVLAPFFTRHKLGRPFVIAKWAQSLDAKLATASGDSRWISSERSRAWVHRLRARVDAILVGSGTVLADDPMLTARDVPVRRVARRVVLDRQLRIPESCRLVGTAGKVPTLVFTDAARGDYRKAHRLRRKGVDVVACRTVGGRLSLNDCLKILAAGDVTNLLIEGGPTVLSAFFAAALVDEAFVFTAPMFIGGPKSSAVMPPASSRSLSDCPRPAVVAVQRRGDDVLHRLRYESPFCP